MVLPLRHSNDFKDQWSLLVGIDINIAVYRALHGFSPLGIKETSIEFLEISNPIKKVHLHWNSLTRFSFYVISGAKFEPELPFEYDTFQNSHSRTDAYNIFLKQPYNTLLWFNERSKDEHLVNNQVVFKMSKDTIPHLDTIWTETLNYFYHSNKPEGMNSIYRTAFAEFHKSLFKVKELKTPAGFFSSTYIRQRLFAIATEPHKLIHNNDKMDTLAFLLWFKKESISAFIGFCGLVSSLLLVHSEKERTNRYLKFIQKYHSS